MPRPAYFSTSFTRTACCPTSSNPLNYLPFPLLDPEVVAEVPAAAAAPAQTGLVEEQARAAPVGLSLTILNMPKMMNDVKFIRKLKELGIKYHKADKPFNKAAGKLRFENQEDRQAAFTALNGTEIDGLVWQVRLPADMGGEIGGTVSTRTGGGRGGGRNGGNKASEDGEEGEGKGEGAAEDGEEGEGKATTVKDAVVPWHHMEYAQQKIKKYRQMRDILEKISKRVKKDSVNGMPDWLVPITKQKTKWLACPLDQVIPSPFTEGYRNKTELTIGLNAQGKPAIGFLLGAMKDGVVAVGDPREALSVSTIHAELHQLVEPFVVDSGLPVWDKSTHTGFWRLCLLRSTINEDSLVMFQINTAAVTPEQLEKTKTDLVQFITQSNNPIKDKSTHQNLVARTCRNLLPIIPT